MLCWTAIALWHAQLNEFVEHHASMTNSGIQDMHPLAGSNCFGPSGGSVSLETMATMSRKHLLTTLTIWFCLLGALSSTNGQQQTKAAETCPLELSDASPTIFDGPLKGYRYP
jgi:hypothetical protein